MVFLTLAIPCLSKSGKMKSLNDQQEHYHLFCAVQVVHANRCKIVYLVRAASPKTQFGFCSLRRHKCFVLIRTDETQPQTWVFSLHFWTCEHSANAVDAGGADRAAGTWGLAFRA